MAPRMHMQEPDSESGESDQSSDGSFGGGAAAQWEGLDEAYLHAPPVQVGAPAPAGAPSAVQPHVTWLRVMPHPAPRRPAPSHELKS